MFNYKFRTMKKISILTFLIVTFISVKSVAQDVHFSQLQNTPLLTLIMEVTEGMDLLELLIPKFAS